MRSARRSPRGAPKPTPGTKPKSYHQEGKEVQQRIDQNLKIEEVGALCPRPIMVIGVLAVGIYFGCYWYPKFKVNSNLLSPQIQIGSILPPPSPSVMASQHRLESTNNVTKSWLLEECAIPAGPLPLEEASQEVHRLDRCWTMQMAQAQTELNKAACNHEHNMLRTCTSGEADATCTRSCPSNRDALQNLYSSLAGGFISVAIIFVLWLCCWIEVLPYAILELAYARVRRACRYLETWRIVTLLYSGLGEDKEQRTKVAGLVVSMVIFMHVHCILMPALVLHMQLEKLCGQLLQKHQAFYDNLQDVAVVRVHNRTFACELLPDLPVDILFVDTMWAQAVWYGVAVPLATVMWQAYTKLMEQKRETCKQQERYSRLINFSLNMVVEKKERGSSNMKQTFTFRTFCELPTKDLIHNTALRASLKKAARCTQTEFPLLHVLDPQFVRALNLLCLNTISQRIGATFFAMDQSPALSHNHDESFGNYCFGDVRSAHTYTHTHEHAQMHTHSRPEPRIHTNTNK